MSWPPDFYGHILPVMQHENPVVFVPVLPAVTPEIRLEAEEGRIESPGILQELLPARGDAAHKVPSDVKAPPCKTFSHRLRPELLHENG